MANIRLDMTVSLDGYVAGPRDDADAPMGVGGFRLFNWLDHRDEPGPHGPVLLGQGRRLFDHLPAEHVELDLVRRLTTPEVTHVRYRVYRP